MNGIWALFPRIFSSWNKYLANMTYCCSKCLTAIRIEHVAFCHKNGKRVFLVGFKLFPERNHCRKHEHVRDFRLFEGAQSKGKLVQQGMILDWTGGTVEKLGKLWKPLERNGKLLGHVQWGFLLLEAMLRNAWKCSAKKSFTRFFSQFPHCHRLLWIIGYVHYKVHRVSFLTNYSFITWGN